MIPDLKETTIDALNPFEGDPSLILTENPQGLWKKIPFIVPFWEKNPALAARRFSIYNAMVCNTIEEQPIQSLTAPITSFG